MRSLFTAFAATLLSTLSLLLWRIGYASSDWAALALIPIAIVIGVGLWRLTLDPWKAHLQIALRENSPLGRILTGKTRTLFVLISFTSVSVILLAWQAAIATVSDATIMLMAYFLSGCAFLTSKNLLSRHLHPPFARDLAISLGTWVVALPFILIIALSTWAWARIPGAMLDASLQDALQVGLNRLPARGGWIAAILSVPYGYEAAKLWAVVQLREYPIVGVLFSLDTALFSFVICRAGVISTHFVQSYVLRNGE
ncbi:hypothetical protein LHP98_12915 [Rhodobacter sp. Har01]|uniref:hypothetical protein n=1 Tax=Rhodobacter sp. Har01 TaxID=2883999 RepID=UPI001D08F857|nr:hypothetical protein [Rhodobacter sp. Har01]MCB6179026.1 hypothetical protein [Rhodobacter sp. Har01]